MSARSPNDGAEPVERGRTLDCHRFGRRLRGPIALGLLGCFLMIEFGFAYGQALFLLRHRPPPGMRGPPGPAQWPDVTERVASIHIYEIIQVVGAGTFLGCAIVAIARTICSSRRKPQGQE